MKTSRSVLSLLLGILLCGALPMMAQNSTNSPYTRFGYGMQADRSFAAGRAMGGIGYGLRSARQINPMNPASYTGMDSLTFLFDGGISAQMSWFNDGTHRQRDLNGGFNYAAMQFPLHRRLAVSIGLLPFSLYGSIQRHGGIKRNLRGPVIRAVEREIIHRRQHQLHVRDDHPQQRDELDEHVLLAE